MSIRKTGLSCYIIYGMEKASPKYLGLTGLNASGKGTVAKLLIERGFNYYSLSDIVREEATAMGLDHSRENLILVGNKLRKEHGPAVLAQKVVEKLVGAGRDLPLRDDIHPAVIDSIRNLAEINELRKLPGFILIAIDAPVKLRFERAKKRGRTGFEKTLQDFIKIEQQENSKDPARQQLFECVKQADYIVVNDKTEKELKDKVATFFRR